MSFANQHLRVGSHAQRGSVLVVLCGVVAVTLGLIIVASQLREECIDVRCVLKCDVRDARSGHPIDGVVCLAGSRDAVLDQERADWWLGVYGGRATVRYGGYLYGLSDAQGRVSAKGVFMWCFVGHPWFDKSHALPEFYRCEAIRLMHREYEDLVVVRQPSWTWDAVSQGEGHVEAGTLHMRRRK